MSNWDTKSKYDIVEKLFLTSLGNSSLQVLLTYLRGLRAKPSALLHPKKTHKTSRIRKISWSR